MATTPIGHIGSEFCDNRATQNVMSDTTLDQIAASLKAEFPECKEEIDRQLERMKKEQQELAVRGQPGESVHMLAVDFRAYVVNLPCAEDRVARMKHRAQQSVKKKRQLNRRRFTRR